MENKNFSTSILVEQSPKEVFKAVTNVRGWWSEEITGNAEKVDDIFEYHFRDIHRCKVKIVEAIPDQKIVWLVLENHFNFTKDEDEWTGNKMIFEISRKDDKTLLHMTQVGLVPEYECYEVCNTAWTNYVQNSMYKLITTGKGEPNSNEGNEFEKTRPDRELDFQN